MTVDDRLRSASQEMKNRVAGLTPPDFRKRRRGRAVARWTALAAVTVLVTTLVWSGLVFGFRNGDVAGVETSVEDYATCEAALPAASEYGPISSILRAESATAEAATRWQESRHGPDVTVESALGSLPPESKVTICMYKGEFATPRGPPNEDGSSNPPHDVIRLLVLENGEVILDSAGYEGAMEPEVPGDMEFGRIYTNEMGLLLFATAASSGGRSA